MLIVRTWGLLLVGAALVASACGGGASEPASPSPTLAAPTASSPIAGKHLTEAAVTLTVANAAITGSPGTVKYRFEWSEADSFPADTRTGSKQDIPQGTGSTSYTITDTLLPNSKLYWRARAYTDTATGAWSATETFFTLDKGFIQGQRVSDPLTDGTTVGTRFGGTLLMGQGWKADSDSDGLDYVIPTCSSCTVEFDVTNFGKAQGAPALKDYKWLTMGDLGAFGSSFTGHPWKMHLEQRSDGDGTGMKVVWRNGAAAEGANPGDHTIRTESTVDWRSDVVYRFTFRWTPSGYTVSVGTVNADGTVSGNQVWFQDGGFGAFPYAPPTHVISLGTRPRAETMKGAIWRNVRITPN